MYRSITKETDSRETVQNSQNIFDQPSKLKEMASGRVL